jgi:hypothetical protein
MFWAPSAQIFFYTRRTIELEHFTARIKTTYKDL